MARRVSAWWRVQFLMAPSRQIDTVRRTEMTSHLDHGGIRDNDPSLKGYEPRTASVTT